ncbi:MAG: hypothetical protein M0R03_14845 [Novosphingobium sp.]|nr:hypothetical protein [Novosphingobium sp.]
MKLLPLNDEASSGVLAYFLITIAAGLIIYMLLGPIFDILFATAGDPAISSIAPISQERVDILVFLRVAISAVPFLLIFLPTSFYAIVASLRQDGGDI